MFESDDWIFEDAFDGDDVEEEETRWNASSPCQNGAKTSSVKRRRVDSREVLPSVSTASTFVRHADVDLVATVEANDPPFKTQDNDDVARRDLLLGIFQSSTSREIVDFAKEVENDPSGIPRKTQRPQSKVAATSKVFRYEESREKSHEPMTEDRLAKEVKLIRIFPGPAGLIPDVKNDDNISAASYLSSVEDVERNKRATKHREIKSQDGKNLFGEKAWKLLLNDLPKNFLQNYKISTVKDKATSSHCESTKVKFIAGVLDYIDHSHDDPFVVLKDSTGSIEGTIHRDIPLTYPGILEPNVVILLRDVGLLKTTTYVVTNKYHILVSLVNLLAIYSDKGRIVSTSLMESILSQTTSNVELNKINDRMPVSKSAYISGLQKMAESRNASRPASSFSHIPSSSPRIETREPELANGPLMLRPKNDKNCKVTATLLSYFTNDNEYDSDDEILSQLDVDNVFDEPKKHC